ncbi:MAG: hypothetical protein HOV83_28620 [Catenulispora sp.]|nr:hypothetical protein [Catenulispora sp.]
MSAQDDVLAAFGEPRKRVVEADEAPVAETEEAAVGAEEPVIEAEAAEDKAEKPLAEAAEPAAEIAEPTIEVPVAEAEEVEPGESAETQTDTEAATPAVDEQAPSAATAANQPTVPLQQQPQPQPQPQPPTQPYLDPSAFFTQLQAESTPAPERRWPRLLLRYASALALAGAVGAGTAYAVTLPQRTDIPTLATPTDNRFDFPSFAEVAPPAGKPGPGDEANGNQVHYADLRQYLLPVPKGAVLKEDGWEPAKDFVSAMESASLAERLNDAGLRRIAWRGWTSEDGQHIVIELFQFPDHAAAYALENDLVAAVPRKVGKPETVVPKYTVPVLGDTTEDLAVRRFDTVEGLPGQIGRRAVFRSGDVVAVVTSTAPKKISDVSIDQVLLLQAEMLQ